MLVKSPSGEVVAGPDGDVADDGDPHIRVRLQAERQDRDADEENGDDTDHLHYRQ